MPPRIGIVGCSRGIGRTTALHLAAAGADLLLFDREPATAGVADEVAAGGREARFHAIDVTDAEALGARFAEAVGDGPLDGLCYFVRGRERVAVLDFAPENWDREFGQSARGAFFCAQAALPHLQRSTSFPGMVLISSLCSEVVAADESVAYHASKAAIDQTVRYLAVSAGPLGVRVNAVQPGFIVQDEHRERYDRDDNVAYRRINEAALPVGYAGRSQDVAEAVGFLLSDRARFITGQILTVDGGSMLIEQSYLLRSFTAG